MQKYVAIKKIYITLLWIINIFGVILLLVLALLHQLEGLPDFISTKFFAMLIAFSFGGAIMYTLGLILGGIFPKKIKIKKQHTYLLLLISCIPFWFVCIYLGFLSMITIGAYSFTSTYLPVI